MQTFRTVLTGALAVSLVIASQDVVSKPPGGPTEDLNENAILSLLTPKVIFATQSLYTGDLVSEALDMGYAAKDGLDAADYLCQASAEEGGFNGNFKAVISSSQEDASARLSKSLGPYVRPDGAPVAGSFAQLFSTRSGSASASPEVPPIFLINAVLQTELGQYLTGPGSPISRRIWTGSMANGVYSQFGGGGPPSNAPFLDTCDDWTSSASEVDCGSISDPGTCGRTGQLLSTETLWLNNVRDGCDTPHRLYCAEQ